MSIYNPVGYDRPECLYMYDQVIEDLNGEGSSRYNRYMDRFKRILLRMVFFFVVGGGRGLCHKNFFSSMLFLSLFF